MQDSPSTVSQLQASFSHTALDETTDSSLEDPNEANMIPGQTDEANHDHLLSRVHSREPPD